MKGACPTLEPLPGLGPLQCQRDAGMAARVLRINKGKYDSAGADHGRVSFSPDSPLLLPPHAIAVTSTAMFSLFRRISYGAIPRADRPWEDDREFFPPCRVLSAAFRSHAVKRWRVSGFDDYSCSSRVFVYKL